MSQVLAKSKETNIMETDIDLIDTYIVGIIIL
jgi:hypothetical protein